MVFSLTLRCERVLLFARATFRNGRVIRVVRENQRRMTDGHGTKDTRHVSAQGWWAYAIVFHRYYHLHADGPYHRRSAPRNLPPSHGIRLPLASRTLSPLFTSLPLVSPRWLVNVVTADHSFYHTLLPDDPRFSWRIAAATKHTHDVGQSPPLPLTVLPPLEFPTSLCHGGGLFVRVWAGRGR